MKKPNKLTGKYISEFMSLIINDIDRSGISNKEKQGQLYTTLSELMKLRKLYPNKITTNEKTC